jgi:hypothetical protein
MMVVLNPVPPEGAQPISQDATQEEVSPFQEQLELLRDAILRLQDLVASSKQLQDKTLAQMAEDIAADKRRIKALENKGHQQETDITLAHINALALELLIRAKSGQRGVTYAEAAKILGIGKSRVCQLRSLIASDSRFNISWHPARKNMKIICLKHFIAKGIVELNVQQDGENRVI